MARSFISSNPADSTAAYSFALSFPSEKSCCTLNKEKETLWRKKVSVFQCTENRGLFPSANKFPK
jgi:hypothetical protein